LPGSKPVLVQFVPHIVRSGPQVDASVSTFASIVTGVLVSALKLASFPKADSLGLLLPHPAAASIASEATKQVRRVAHHPIAESFRTCMSVSPLIPSHHELVRVMRQPRRSEDRSLDAISRVYPAQRLCAERARA
jgi:hypothetical protein